MWKLFWLLLVLCPQRFVEASLTLCDSPQNYLEVEEGKQNSTFTCSGLKQAETVQWSLEYPPPSNQPSLIGSCFTNLSCSVQIKAIFDLSRTTDTSVITVNETAILNKNIFSTATFICRTFMQESKTDESRCQVDYIYPAENIICKIEFSGEIWRLTGQCVISKVYSTKNNYGCYLYQTLEGSQESTRVGFYSMDLGLSTANKYLSGSCNLTSFLPPNGRYSYTVVILPGKVKVPTTFNGNNTIRQPPVSPTHNCPLFVKEGDTVNCKCSVDDYGSPPGKLTWNTGSDQLLLTGVEKEQHGMTYVCSVMWNNTVFQPVNYTLLIAYPPTQISFKLNNTSESVTVTEKSPVTMLCQSDGRPTPNMTITDVTNGNRVVHSQPGGNVTLADHRVQTRYDKVVECEDTGEYRCSSDNIIGSKYQAVKLFVMCAPRRNPADANYTTPAVEEGKSVRIELIVYPTSVNVTKYFLGPNISGNEQPARESVFLVGCKTSPPSSYKVICTITVINVNSDTAGFYKVIVINQAGNVAFAFQALPRNTTVQEAATAGTNIEEPPAGAIAGGVVGGVVIAGLVAIAIVCFVRRKVTSLELCSVWNYLEVKEGRDDNTFTYSGLTDQQEVSWVIQSSVVKTCPPVPPSCTALAYRYFNVSRTSNQNFYITIMATRISDLSILEEISCQTNTELKTCQLDIIYPAENSTCHVEFSRETWTVTGWCSVPKLHSTKFLNNSGCYFHQTSQSAGTTATLGFYKMNLKPSTQTGYYTGTCNMTSYLPSEGQYSYTVIIMPGQVNASPTFTGSNEIRRPIISPTHDCPLFVRESATLNCKCSTSDLGSPPGKLNWNNSASDQLMLTNIMRDKHGTNYICSLMWNNTVGQSVSYTLIVTYPPTQLSFKLNNITSDVVTVAEKSTVTMLCQSDGRPTPNITITFVTSNNHVLESLPAGNVTLTGQGGELSHIVTAATCEASGEYKCTTDNGVGRQDHSVSLFVLCAPRLIDDASNSSEQGQMPSVTFTGKPEQIHFRMTAFPAPVVLMKLFLGSSNCSNVKAKANDTVISANCVTQSLASVICTITIDNVLSEHAGIYEVVVGNNIGQLTLSLEVKLFQTDKEALCEDGYSRGLAAGLGIGIGVTLGVILGVLVPAVIWIWRRKWILPCKRNEDRSPVELAVSREESGKFEQSCNPSGNTYDALHINDVGLTSHYSSLHSAKKSKLQSTEYELSRDSLKKKTVAQTEVESAYSNSSL